jgi:hypothetical protein
MSWDWNGYAGGNQWQKKKKKKKNTPIMTN